MINMSRAMNSETGYR